MYTFNESSMFSLSYFKCNESQMGNESLMSNIVCYRISKEIFPFLNVALRERQHFLGFFSPGMSQTYTSGLGEF